MRPFPFPSADTDATSDTVTAVAAYVLSLGLVLVATSYAAELKGLHGPWIKWLRFAYYACGSASAAMALYVAAARHEATLVVSEAVNGLLYVATAILAAILATKAAAAARTKQQQKKGGGD